MGIGVVVAVIGAFFGGMAVVGAMIAYCDKARREEHAALVRAVDMFIEQQREPYEQQQKPQQPQFDAR